jgi:hypothetical protein
MNHCPRSTRREATVAPASAPQTRAARGVRFGSHIALCGAFKMCRRDACIACRVCISAAEFRPLLTHGKTPDALAAQAHTGRTAIQRHRCARCHGTTHSATAPTGCRKERDLFLKWRPRRHFTARRWVRDCEPFSLLPFCGVGRPGDRRSPPGLFIDHVLVASHLLYVRNRRGNPRPDADEQGPVPVVRCSETRLSYRRVGGDLSFQRLQFGRRRWSNWLSRHMISSPAHRLR